MASIEIKIEWNDVQLLIVGDYEPEYPGSRDEPPEGAYFNFDEVYVKDSKINICGLFEDCYEEVQEHCLKIIQDDEIESAKEWAFYQKAESKGEI